MRAEGSRPANDPFLCPEALLLFIACTAIKTLRTAPRSPARPARCFPTGPAPPAAPAAPPSTLSGGREGAPTQRWGARLEGCRCPCVRPRLQPRTHLRALSGGCGRPGRAEPGRAPALPVAARPPPPRTVPPRHRLSRPRSALAAAPRWRRGPMAGAVRPRPPGSAEGR